MYTDIDNLNNEKDIIKNNFIKLGGWVRVGGGVSYARGLT